MKLVTYDAGAGARAGAVCGQSVVDLERATGGELPSDLKEVLSAPQWAETARSAVAGAPQGALTALSDVRLLAPIPRPGKVVCLGLNYGEHAAEGNTPLPVEPIVFCKAPTSVVGPGEAIVLPEASQKVDYEVELAAVIGRPAKCVSAREAAGHVAGYTILNDVSGRDYQQEKPGGQWFLGKSFDTFCPIGPWLVTPDEAPDPYALAISCEVSGEVLQDSSTANMAFRVPEIIAYVSRVLTLEVGDVIGTGTPSGVGESRTPPRFLRAGDVVRCTIEGIGTLENPVR